MKSIVSFQQYNFRYAGSTRETLSDINLEITPGEVVVIAGHSGCGKTTLLRSIVGLIPHMYTGELHGSVLVDGLDVSSTPISQLARNVGFVFQNPENQIFMFSVARDVAFGLENLGTPADEIKKRVDWALRLLDIQHLADKAPYELSEGQKQRVAIAGVLSMKPSLLILDEPTSLLDPYTASGLIALVKKLRDELGITVIIVEHRLELLARISSRMIIMNEGRVAVDGPPNEALTSNELEALGVGVPTSTKLHLLLGKTMELGKVSLTVEDLAAKINGKLK